MPQDGVRTFLPLRPRNGGFTLPLFRSTGIAALFRVHLPPAEALGCPPPGLYRPRPPCKGCGRPPAPLPCLRRVSGLSPRFALVPAVFRCLFSALASDPPAPPPF